MLCTYFIIYIYIFLWARSPKHSSHLLLPLCPILEPTVARVSKTLAHRCAFITIDSLKLIINVLTGHKFKAAEVASEFQLSLWLKLPRTVVLRTVDGNHSVYLSGYRTAVVSPRADLTRRQRRQHICRILLLWVKTKEKTLTPARLDVTPLAKPTSKNTI